MIYATTPRLRLRALTRDDLPRVVELIGDWDVARWLARVPYPYAMKDAEEFFGRSVEECQRFVLADKKSDALLGIAGLNDDALFETTLHERAVGYWLGKPFWGQGLMSEAVLAVIDLAFQQPFLKRITASTDPQNLASQNVLRKAGLRYLGTFPRTKEVLRAGPEATRWEMTRVDFEKMQDVGL